MSFSNPRDLVSALKSQNPSLVSQAQRWIFQKTLTELGKTDPARFGGVAETLAELVAKSRNGRAAFDPFARLEKNQQKIEFAAALQDLILITSDSHQKALQNQQQNSSESSRGASPRTPYGALSDWAKDGASREQEMRLENMKRAEVVDVGTAHPTESKSPQKVAKHNGYLELVSNPELSEEDVPELFSTMRDFLVTDSTFINTDNDNAKTVKQEVEDQVVTLKNKLRAMPAIVREQERAARAISFNLNITDPGHWINTRPLEFRTWVGGDRDGNFNTTAALTEWSAQRYAEVGREIMIEFLEPLRGLPLIDDALRELAVGDSSFSVGPLREQLTRVMLSFVREKDQEKRSQLEDALIELNHMAHGNYLSVAQMHVRQDAKIMADMVAQMLGNKYKDSSDDQKSQFLLHLMEEDASKLTERFASLKTYYAEQFAQHPMDDNIKVRLEMTETFAMLKDNPKAWDLFIIANCGDGLEGSALGRNRHFYESLLLLKAAGADHVVNLCSLYESKKQLRESGELTDNLLEQKVVIDFLALHNNELVVQIALSDTTRQHGMGIRGDQEEAQVSINMSGLNHNVSQPRDQWKKVKIFFGGASATTRGGRDPVSWPFSLARKIRARAIQVMDGAKRKFSDELIAHTVAPCIMQTRQGRDNTSRYYGFVAAAQSHLGEMVAGAMNFARFLAVKPKRVDDAKLIAEDKADQRAMAVLDKAINFYEGYFGGAMEAYGERAVPWRAAWRLNISSRATSRNMKNAKSLTKNRAISQKIALQLLGGWDNATMGWGAALAEMSFEGRRELHRDSRLFRELNLTVLANAQYTDLDAEYRHQGFERPRVFDHDAYQRLLQLPSDSMDDLTQEEILHWKDVHFRETCALGAETLYGDPAARKLSPAQALRPLGRLSIEMAEVNHLTRIARDLMIDVSHAVDQGAGAVMEQIEAHFARGVFDGMATPHALLSPGFSDHEFRLHELLSNISATSAQGLIRPRYGAPRNGDKSHTWPVGCTL